MKQRGATSGMVGVIVVLAAFAWSFSAQAAEKKKFSGTNHEPQTISQTVVSPGDVPKHELVLNVRRYATTSSDPEWNETEEMNYGQSDQVAGTGTHRGYFRRFHKNGDTTYGTYEGTHQTTVKADGSWEAISEGKWQFTGGTGKFKHIKGSGTYRGKATAQGRSTDWEGEVEY
jgi:hypothetical protein